MSEEERWLQLDERLKRLDFLDRQEEAELLSEAYYNLVGAYQEARMLNRELEEMICDLTQQVWFT